MELNTEKSGNGKEIVKEELTATVYINKNGNITSEKQEGPS